MSTDESREDEGIELARAALSLLAAYQEISGSSNLEAALRLTAREAMILTHSDVSFLTVLKNGRLPVVAAWSKTGELHWEHPREVSPTHSVSADAIRLRRSVRLTKGYHVPKHWDSDERYPKHWRYLGVPLLAAGEPLGALTLGHPDESLFDPERVLIAEVLAATASLVIRQASGYQETIKEARFFERERIVRDLHDSVVQSICAIRVKVGDILRYAKLDPETRLVMEEVRSVSEEANNELRMLVSSLEGSRSSQSSRQLDAVLRSEVDEHIVRGGVPVTLLVDEDIPVISDEIVEALRCVVHESLTNVRKHSNASGVVVGLVFKASSVGVFVQDDGAGIVEGSCSSRKSGLHFGLESLRRLVERMKGEFLVQNNEDGAGLMVRAMFPLVDESAS